MEENYEEWKTQEAERKRIERENLPESTITIDHWEGQGDEFNQHMAMKQWEAKKDAEYR